MKTRKERILRYIEKADPYITLKEIHRREFKFEFTDEFQLGYMKREYKSDFKHLRFYKKQLDGFDPEKSSYTIEELEAEIKYYQWNVDYTNQILLFYEMNKRFPKNFKVSPVLDSHGLGLNIWSILKKLVKDGVIETAKEPRRYWTPVPEGFWMDPAGGLHSDDDDDPAAMYI